MSPQQAVTQSRRRSPSPPLSIRLTKQFEGGACKCGAYWTAGQYGPFRLEHVSTEGGEDTAEKDVSGFNFHVGGNNGPSSDAPNIKRTFLLSHTQYPDEKPRKVTQLQCVAWPDFDVPEDPRLLLGLVKEVDKAAVDLPDEEDQSRKAPVLVHCKCPLPNDATPSFRAHLSLCSLQALRVSVVPEVSWSWTRSWMACDANTSDNTAGSAALIPVLVGARAASVTVGSRRGDPLRLLRTVASLRWHHTIPTRACTGWHRATYSTWHLPARTALYWTNLPN